MPLTGHQHIVLYSGAETLTCIPPPWPGQEHLGVTPLAGHPHVPAHHALLVCGDVRRVSLRSASGRVASREFKLSVGRTCPVYLLEIEGLLTQGSRPGRTFGESVGGILGMDSSDWSNGIRHHVFDIRPDNEFKVNAM